MAWECGKCAGGNFPAHHRHCPLRDPRDQFVVFPCWPDDWLTDPAYWIQRTQAALDGRDATPPGAARARRGRA
jgi:hypothetical protein